MAASMATALLVASAAPASAFNMRRALQAVENLTQWSVMAEHCGETRSASEWDGEWSFGPQILDALKMGATWPLLVIEVILGR